MNHKILITAIAIVLFSFPEIVQSQMVWNQACQFNGTSGSYIAIPHSAALDITNEFSLEAFINPVNSTSPASQIILQKREGIHNSGYTLFLSNGKVAIRSNQQTVLVGKTIIPNDQWTYIAGSFDGGTFYIHVNGVYDTSRAFLLPPVSNTDSLFIGKGFNSPFNGKIDEVKVWADSFQEAFRKISLSTGDGVYNKLKLSLTFQNLNPSGTLFTVKDFSGNNSVYNRGAAAYDLSGSPNGLFSINECINLYSSGIFVKCPDHPNVSPVSGITVEAWIWPIQYNTNSAVLSTVVHKGTTSQSRKDYTMLLNLNRFEFYVNETRVANITGAGVMFPLRKWTHVAFTYSGSDGYVQFMRNGKLEWDDTSFVGNIHDSSDSLFVGGTSSVQSFTGYVDELRITSAALSYGEIANKIFTSINESNDPAITNIVYNFDGSLSSNTDAGPVLTFNSTTGQFSHNAYFGGITPISPLTNSISTNFPDGYYLSSSNLRIPASGTSGFMDSDTLFVAADETINDVNVYVGLNHTDEDDLIISLISPSGTAVTLYSTSSLINPSDHVVTIFDDQADSSLGSNKYIMYTPRIKPLNNLNSALSGLSTKGKWMLKIQDAGVPDTGYLAGWGIQFNNQVQRKEVLNLGALVQGFYDPVSNLMTEDTIRVFVRSNVVPYSVLDSSKAVLSDSGEADLVFNSVPTGMPVYLQFMHRNSLETWSMKPDTGNFAVLNSVHFNPFTSHLDYDTRTSPSKVFGSNVIPVDNSPVRYALFGGDANHDGSIDLSDIIIIFNDANAFLTGYINSDVTGDNIADLSDLVLTFNNSNNFVSVIKP